MGVSKIGDPDTDPDIGGLFHVEVSHIYIYICIGISGAKNRPQYILILIMRTPKRAALVV